MEPKYILWIVIVAIVLLLIAAIAYAFHKKNEIIEFFKRPEVIQFIREMIVKAEDVITGTKRGQERLKWVCEQIIAYARIVAPGIAKYLSAASMMRIMIQVIQKLFDELAQHLDDGTTRAMFTAV